MCNYDVMFRWKEQRFVYEIKKDSSSKYLSQNFADEFLRKNDELDP